MAQKNKICHTTLTGVKLAICRALDQAGYDPLPLCSQAKLSPPNRLQPLKRDSTVKLADLMKLAIAVTGDPNFMLRAATQINLTAFASYGAAIIASTTLHTAMLRGQRFSQLISGYATYRIEPSENMTTAVFYSTVPDWELDENLILLYLASALHVGRTLYQSNFSPLAVRLRQVKPDNAEPFVAFFGCPVQFDDSENSVTVSEEILVRPISALDPRLSNLAQDLAIEDMQKLSAFSMADEVRARIEKLLAEGEPKIASVASHMGLSARSLRRKLAAEEHTFAQLLDDTRKQIAHDKVLKPAEQIKDLAYDLGFSDQSNFNRAFKRWYNVSPTEFRRLRGTAHPD